MELSAFGISLIWWVALVFGAAIPLVVVLMASRTPREPTRWAHRSQHEWNDLIVKHNRGEITLEEFSRLKKEVEERSDVA